MRASCVSLIVGLLLAYGVSGIAFARDVPTDKKVTDALEARMNGLIRQLGDDDFATRERAQAELARFGLEAFDVLCEARQSDDIEIRLRARYLLQSMKVNWALDTDPPNVKKILANYSSQGDAERATRMDRLAKLEDGAGLTALCRLARFEPSMPLAKTAALKVITQPVAEKKDHRSQIAKKIRNSVRTSRRTPSKWLVAYADTIEQPESMLDTWKQYIQDEQQTFTQFPDRSSRVIVRDLVRWNAEQLWVVQRPEEAVVMVRRLLELLDGTKGQIHETVAWLMERGAWSSVDEVARRFPDQFENHTTLMYLMAEAQLRQGKKDIAEASAEKARSLQPDDADPHLEAALALQERGLNDWCEREYRHVLTISKLASISGIRTRYNLSEMLHDHGRELEAAEVLKPMEATMKTDEGVRKVVSQLYGDPGSLTSRMNYFYGLHEKKQGDVAKMRDRLLQGVQNDPWDADVLIAMHRLPEADAEWTTLTNQKIEAAVKHFRTEIRNYDRELRGADDTNVILYYRRRLAQSNNQLAWLVGNTVGDYDEALRCSQRSLELRPDTAGYLDTLGRCYYAKKDYQNAVKVQRRAVELEPHSGQIRNQLTLFEEAAKKHGVKKDSAKSENVEESDNRDQATQTSDDS